MWSQDSDDDDVKCVVLQIWKYPSWSSNPIRVIAMCLYILLEFDR